jgi:hypothetical protein
MKGLIEYKKMILKIVGFILFFHTTLFANPNYNENVDTQRVYSSEQPSQSSSITNKEDSNKVEVSLHSFGGMSISIMLILTSLLGAFFVRDEFQGILD